MRTTFKIALASVLVFTLAAASPALYGQARRSTTTTSNSSSSDTRSTATRSTGTTASRSAGTTASRSTGTTANRQSTTTSTASRSTGTATRSTASRSTAAPSGTTSTQVRRGTTNSTNSAAQVNRNTGNSNTQTTTARRSTGTSNTETSTARRQTTTTRSTNGNAAATTEAPARKATVTRSNGTTAAPTTQNGTTASRVVRSNTTSARGLTSAPEASAAAKEGNTRGGVNVNRGAVANVTTGNHAGMKMDEGRNLNRIPPRERDFMAYDRPGAFYGHDPHYFGYRVHSLPPRYRRISYWGRDYYYYNNIYYLRYGNVYVISRPPFGLALDIAIRDAVFASVRFSYYHNVYRTFDIVDSNYRTILEQNRIIARNNAVLASQNSALALNSQRALSAYEIASALGLVQSFANINTEYFYEDGVFYVINKKNRYEVIVPPAGALVSELPDDYDTIVLNGVEYYKVDDTVYRLVLVDGVPALEVLGQMYGSMAKKYNYYY